MANRQLVDMYGGFSLESVTYGDRTMFRIRPQRQVDSGGCSSCTSCG